MACEECDNWKGRYLAISNSINPEIARLQEKINKIKELIDD